MPTATEQVVWGDTYVLPRASEANWGTPVLPRAALAEPLGRVE